MQDSSLFHGNIRPSYEAVKNRIETKLPGFLYIEGYTGSDSTVLLQCRDCGAYLRKNMRTIRKSKGSRICPTCEARKKEEARRAELEAKEAERKAKRAERELRDKEKRYRAPTACKCCGALFIPKGSRRSYCSPECSRKVANNHKDRRLKGQTDRDWNITVPALVHRDHNICYLCGGQCDSTDYTISQDGHFIAGANYPSVDHVIPIAKGGEHKWSNVKLAHLRCNVAKRDKLPRN